MASFFLIIDSDMDRRTAAARAFSRVGRIYPHLEEGSHSHGSATLAWYASPEAPLRLGPGGTEWTLGDPDGLNFRVRFVEAGTEVTADTLGVMPVYYAQAGSVAVVASSPWALSLHPLFPPRLDPEGTAAVLLTNNILAGRTVSAGCRRLAVGHRLEVYPPKAISEVLEYRPRVTDRYHGLPKEECAHILFDSLADAVHRHLGTGRSWTVLLSGGLDSRMITALAHEQGISLQAVTTGLPSDNEFQIARLVAATIGIPHHRLEDPAEASLDRAIQWGGFTAAPVSGGWESGLVEELRRWAPRSTSGYLLDPIIGGTQLVAGYDEATRITGFEPHFAKTCRSGVGVERLGRLLRQDVFGKAVEWATEAARESYRQAGDTDLERSWWWGLTHRGRFHVGEGMWQLAFGAWHAAPAGDRRLLDTVLGIPLMVQSRRDLQILAIKQRLPRLARVPRDRNSWDTTPLDPRFRETLKLEVVNRLWEKAGHWSGGRIRRPERRYYRRIFDFNGTVWRKIRAELEPHRQLAGELFHQPVFDEIVPPADAEWPGGNDAIGASGPKLLLMTVALLRWLRSGARLGTEA